MKFNQLIVSKDFLSAMAVMNEKFSFDQNAIARQFGMNVSLQPVSMPQIQKSTFIYETKEGRRLTVPVYGVGDRHLPSNVFRLSMRLAFVIFGWIDYRFDIITDGDFTDEELEQIENAAMDVLKSM